jgi:hypothetical protein
MSRDVPYDPEEECEDCGKKGAFLFPYCSLCPDCIGSETKEDDI